MAAAATDLSPYRTAEEVRALVRGFETCTLPAAGWTHAAHLTVALWYLLHHEWEEAVPLMRAGIRRYNEAAGVPNTRGRGYHETITLFWMRHVRSFIESNFNEGRSLDALANELVARADKNLPLEHYSRGLLFSWEARAAWAEPDLKPLD